MTYRRTNTKHVEYNGKALCFHSVGTEVNCFRLLANLGQNFMDNVSKCTSRYYLGLG
jgi:hypothetical protein